MNKNIHRHEVTARFQKTETPHALHALDAQKSFFFGDKLGGEAASHLKTMT